MKLVTFRDPSGASRVGVLRGDHVVTVDVPDMRTLFERGDAGMEQAEGARGPDHELAAIELQAPIVPKKFFHTAGNFREHEEESKQVEWSHEIAPWIMFFQNLDSIIGPDEPIIYPAHLTSELDYELELCVVLCEAGKHFGPEEAGEYIGGYTIFNDLTARDIQREEMRSGVFSFCKAIDTFSPLGPWIVTPDEVGDPHDLSMELRVNGEVRQASHSGRMSVTIPEIIAHYSPLVYSRGDVLSTGTISGVAGFRDDAEDYYLHPGDRIECEIERIGVLRNPVISWEEGLRKAGAGSTRGVSRFGQGLHIRRCDLRASRRLDEPVLAVDVHAITHPGHASARVRHAVDNHEAIEADAHAAEDAPGRPRPGRPSGRRALSQEHGGGRFPNVGCHGPAVGSAAIRLVHYYLMGGWGLEDTAAPPVAARR